MSASKAFRAGLVSATALRKFADNQRRPARRQITVLAAHKTQNSMFTFRALEAMTSRFDQ
jgi:hypothetical protein